MLLSTCKEMFNNKGNHLNISNHVKNLLITNQKLNLSTKTKKALTIVASPLPMSTRSAACLRPDYICLNA